MGEKNKIVVYTSIFGKYDGLLPQKKIKGVDFICFTDQDFKASPWKVVKCEPTLKDSTKNARYYKTQPHKVLQDYEVSIWMDGNFLLEALPHEIIAELDKHPIIAFSHGRDCIYDEYEGIMELGRKEGRFKDEPEIMKAQMDRYREEGFPKHFGLCQSNVLIRAHMKPIAVETSDIWWGEIEKGSKRDQLSMFYAIWKTGLDIKVIPQDSRNNAWFYMLGKHRKDFTWKLIRYKFKKLLGLKRSYQM